MITINNKSRYFSASEDMFPTMERNFAWLFGMQTPEQGWKAAMAKAIYRSARASSAEEWQYGFPIGDDGEPMLIEDDFLADLMAAYLEKLPDVAPQAHSFEERRAMMKRLFPLKHTKEYYEIRLDSVMNENPGEFTLEDYLRGVGRCAREELMDKFGPHDSGLDCYFQIVFRKINRIGAERFSREAELLADLAANDITAEARSLYNPWSYYNMAIGMYTGNSGNALYCPTGYLELLRLQDRFVYLPELPYREVDLDQAARNVLTQDQFAQDGGEGTVASWRNTATIRNVHPNTTVAFRMNNLSGSASDLTLYAYGADGKLVKVAPELWSITDETGAAVTELTDGVLYELRVTVADGGDFDLSGTEKEIKLSIVLGK